VREVTRQFVYLPGVRDLFLILDRVEATRSEFAKTWFLHVPTLPRSETELETQVEGHVWRTVGGTLAWLSDPAGVKEVLSTGRAKMFLRTLLPEKALVTIRGGEGHDFWGHPLEPTAQYNHKHKGAPGDAPPLVPWRIEVSPSDAGMRQYFLHVMEIAEERDERMSDVRLQRSADGRRAGVVVARPEGRLMLWFALDGAPSIERVP
jgi:hypothetical protein